ncbi:MAG: hypothetical protein ACEQSC_01015 [Candidatus Nanopelagicaceae bacterium]
MDNSIISIKDISVGCLVFGVRERGLEVLEIVDNNTLIVDTNYGKCSLPLSRVLRVDNPVKSAIEVPKSPETHVIKLNSQPKDNRKNKISSVIKAFKSLKKPDKFIGEMMKAGGVEYVKDTYILCGGDPKFCKGALLFFYYFQEDSKHRQCFDNKHKDIYLLSTMMCLAPSTCLQYIQRMIEIDDIMEERRLEHELEMQQEEINPHAPILDFNGDIVSYGLEECELECKSDNIADLKRHLSIGGTLTENQMAIIYAEIDKPSSAESHLDSCIDIVKTIAKELQQRFDKPMAESDDDYHTDINQEALWVLYYALRECEAIVTPWLHCDEDYRQEEREFQKDSFRRKNENNAK